MERVYIRPEDAKGYPEAIQALLQADLIVLGPGSLFTSILPNLLVSDIRDAIRASEATKIYVCNVATQPGETDGFAVWEHVRALAEHLGDGFCSCVLANSVTDLALPSARSEMVQLGQMGAAQYKLVLADLVDREKPWRHDSNKLAEALVSLYRGQRHSPPANVSSPLEGVQRRAARP